MEAHILFAGAPDQGVLYVSQVFLEAAMEEGWHAACLSSSSRGEITQCLVAVSDAPLVRSHAAQPDVALLASARAADQLEYSVKPNGLLILNASQVRRPPRRHDVDVIFAPTEPDGGEEDPALATIILLGALVSLTGWLSPDSVSKILQRSCKDEAVCQAFRRGVAYIESIGVAGESQPASLGIWD